ncbi:Metallo-dependent phosphatase-like protein [Suillus clintonianus]|uniref:Metallo-dependent phosphatase-like protein n=1 Tax=Suillus clintonianus TaxID=1904413 RepID=UPI001B87E1EA|nr:Metallo-dependent phosphatase-like protein [Suillus clintonianus]KAG2131356.1 Metallo-dependent phosphatase-like protein [Suillus clintonianus]
MFTLSGATLWTHLSFLVLAIFLIFVFITGVLQEIKTNRVLPIEGIDFPDFGYYNVNFIQNIPDNLLPLDDRGNRIIAIGDIHGMYRSLTDLLDEIRYDSERDLLVHVGDLETRATTHESIDVLTFMSTNRILGVRGNNDQKVIEWRAWMNWILSRPGGLEWLTAMDRRWPHLDGDKRLQRGDLENWVLESKYAGWKRMVPAGWHLLGKHYRVARAMSPAHFEYLSSLPFILRSPAGHMAFVHAGLLPSHPTLQPSDPRQPLSHWPTVDDQHDIAKLRNQQELAVLTDIPENKDPWTVTNIKGVTDEGQVSVKPRIGTPWSQLWNDAMSNCSGEAYQSTLLPCYPFTVVYGHAAGRGLDAKRWSIGLDTGCSYGHRLSAIVLDRSSFSPAIHQSGDSSHVQALDSLEIDFGDNGRARVASVLCA